MYFSAIALKAAKISQYKAMISITAFLGISFLLFQYLGFKDLQAKSIALVGPRSNSASSFLFVITFLHMMHVLGGVIALIIFWFKSIRKNSTITSLISLEVLGTYWHFVGILWIYLFLFYNWIG